MRSERQLQNILSTRYLWKPSTSSVFEEIDARLDHLEAALNILSMHQCFDLDESNTLDTVIGFPLSTIHYQVESIILAFMAIREDYTVSDRP